jgi:hypothetical protein
MLILLSRSLKWVKIALWREPRVNCSSLMAEISRFNGKVKIPNEFRSTSGFITQVHPQVQTLRTLKHRPQTPATLNSSIHSRHFALLLIAAIKDRKQRAASKSINYFRPEGTLA